MYTLNPFAGVLRSVDPHSTKTTKSELGNNIQKIIVREAICRRFGYQKRVALPEVTRLID